MWGFQPSVGGMKSSAAKIRSNLHRGWGIEYGERPGLQRTEGRLERELIERARRGDRAAYETIVRQKVETVYRTARAILGNDADADDATQETFIGAWRQIGPAPRDRSIRRLAGSDHDQCLSNDTAATSQQRDRLASDNAFGRPC